MLEKQTLLKGALVLIVAIAVLEFLRPAVMSINILELSAWQIQLVVVVQHFFEVTPIALLAGFTWAFFGFLRYKFSDQTVQFEVEKLYITWMWFEGILLLVAAGLPLPYSIAITGIIMAVKSVLNALRTPPPLTTTNIPKPG